jgi:uncharacterized membrane protein
MKTILDFFKTTILGGLLFLVPVVLMILILRQAISMAGKLLTPVERLMPFESVLGIAMRHIVAVLVILAVCVIAGLVARTRAGGRLNDAFERVVLKRMPGFSLLKSVAGGVAGVQTGSDVAVALAFLDEAWLLCFIMERHESGLLTVFVPSAPTPAAGSIYYLREEQVRRLDVPVATAVTCVMQLGIGSRELLAGQKHLLGGGAADVAPLLP